MVYTRKSFALPKVMKMMGLFFPLPPLITLRPRSVSFYSFNNQYIVNYFLITTATFQFSIDTIMFTKK